MRYWWKTSHSNYKLDAVCDINNQTRELPVSVASCKDGSRVAACLDGDHLAPFIHEDALTLYEGVRRGLRVSNNGPMLGYRKKQPDGSEPYVWLTYKEVIDRAVDFAYGLLDVGIPAGQKTFIGVYAKNRPEWVIAEQGTYNNNSVLVPLYETLGPDACTFIINQSEMSMVICDTEVKAAGLLKEKENIPTLKYLVVMEDYTNGLREAAAREGVYVYHFLDIEKRGREFVNKPALQIPSPGDVCTICYTSGTTGAPKGVMLTHGNVIAAATALTFVRNINFCETDVVISFLPLAHMFERLLECIIFQTGAHVGFFSGDIRRLPEDIKELRPTVIPLVPRVLNRIYDKVMSEVNKSFIKKAVFHFALAFKVRELRNGIVRNDSVFDKLVFNKIRDAMGGRVKLMVTGSAPLAEKVMTFARAAMGCVVLEGYGQTECAAASTLGIEADTRAGHVGIPSICNAVKLVDVPELEYYAKDMVGEVCIRGFNVFKGYYKNDELTREVLDDQGWLHTGDVGRWTENGTLQIIDRKKHIFKLSQGEYVAPEKIEGIYARSKYVAQSFVHGESLKTCLVGVIVPDPEALERVAAERFGLKDVKLKELCSNEAVRQLILEDITAVGKKAGLFSFEQVKDIFLTPDAFSVGNDLLTPTLKNKRPKLKEHFAAQLESMYSKLN
uniref:Long-chain-fatty-acid--CoA ligase n=1 Tax=Ascaris suum TaxID=6253 RepID=F1KXI1_ASCSU